MISQKSIQEIFETARIEDVVGDFVKLNRNGANLKGLCPFHNEKTPSFIVSPAKNIYKCFGCGEGGGPVQFIMSHEQLSYPEALKELARKYNIEIEEDAMTEEEEIRFKLADSIYVVNTFARDFFASQLLEESTGRSIGLSYFKQRGFREEIIKKFHLGYAPASGQRLIEAATKASFKTDLLTNAGLAKNDRDFFRDRVIFPIQNISGKTLGFGGRILISNKKAPKYINTPETEIYNKRKTLFGIYQARKAIVKKDNCYLVEGYTDVISLHQDGIENVVAASGTALTSEQIRLIKRFSRNVTMLFDGDNAGVKAAIRGLNIVIEHDMNVRIVSLPDGEDPDSYLRKVGFSAFEKYLTDESKDFILFKTDLLLDETKDDPVGRADVIKDIVHSIAKVPDLIKRSTYIQSCSQRLQISEDILVRALNKQIHEDIKEKKKESIKKDSKNDNYAPFHTDQAPTIGSEKEVKSIKKSQIQYQERDIIRILLNFSDKKINDQTSVLSYIFSGINDFEDHFHDPVCREILHIYKKAYTDQSQVDANTLTQHEDPAISKLSIDLLASLQEHHMSENWKKFNVHLNGQKLPEENHIKDAKSVIINFKLRKVNEMIQENMKTIQKLTNSEDDISEKKILMRVQIKLFELRKQLAKEQKTVITR